MDDKFRQQSVSLLEEILLSHQNSLDFAVMRLRTLDSNSLNSRTITDIEEFTKMKIRNEAMISRVKDCIKWVSTFELPKE